jgi:ATP-dependent Clp protease ATP-binding subunit ClpB
MTTPTSSPCTCWWPCCARTTAPSALLQRAGVNVPGLLASAEAAIKKLPQVQGQDQVQGGPELGKLLQATEKEAIKRGDQFIASELFLLAVADHKGDMGRWHAPTA